EKESKLSEIVNNANKIMSKDLSFFSLSTNSKKFNTASMSYIDLINLTQRLNRQNNYPKDLQNVYNNPNDIPFAFLGPYPYEDKEMKDSVLKFNLNVKEEQRLKPPVIYPKMEKVNKGDQIKLEYPGYGESMANNSEDQLNPIFFKYILIPEGKKIEEIPSFFTGEVYNKNIGIIIDDNCTLKACSCRIGYKDSQIVHYKFTTSEEKMNLQEKITKPLNHDYIIRPEISSSNANFGNKIIGITKNFSSSNQTGNEQNPNESNRSPNRQSNYQYSNYSRDSKSDMFQDDGL
ncbi:MAG: hypothetical protein MJ252_24875, partial [archaeon]|nr:hypothetical protein [archaeon]